MIRTGAEQVDRLLPGPPLPILMYHSIPPSDRQAGSNDVPASVFRRQLNVLADEGWSLMGLSAALTSRRIQPQRRVVALTLDDGYADAESAADIVAEFDGTCTLYLATDFIAADAQRSARYLTWDVVRALHARGVEIGSHSVSHRPLDLVGPAELRRELVESKKRLDDAIGGLVVSVCYPHGYWTRRVLRAAREAGYENGCTVGRRVARRGDLLALPRLQPRATMSDRAFSKMVRRGEPGLAPSAKRAVSPAWRVARYSAARVGWDLV